MEYQNLQTIDLQAMAEAIAARIGEWLPPRDWKIETRAIEGAVEAILTRDPEGAPAAKRTYGRIFSRVELHDAHGVDQVAGALLYQAGLERVAFKVWRHESPARERTWWKGEPARCRRVLVVVAQPGETTPRLAWHRGLEGTQRRAVEVVYGPHTFYLDDDDVPAEIHERNEREAAADGLVSALRATALRLNPRNSEPGRAGDGWAKVTKGRGGPDWGHRSLPVAEVLGAAT